MNNFKYLVKYFGKDKFRDCSCIYDEEKIFGINSQISLYSKNAIYTHWIEIINQIIGNDLEIS